LFLIIIDGNHFWGLWLCIGFYITTTITGLLLFIVNVVGRGSVKLSVGSILVVVIIIHVGVVLFD
jgi:hypothetical protein